MQLKYILYILTGLGLSFGTAFAGTVTSLPTPRHAQLSALLDAYVLPASPTIEAVLGVRGLMLDGYADLDTLFSKTLGYAKNLRVEKHTHDRVLRILSIPVGAPINFPNREPRQIERIQRNGNALMHLLAKESDVIPLLMFRFKQFDLWSDDSVWAIIARLEEKSTASLFDKIESALPKLSPGKLAELAAAVERAPGDRRMALNVVARARKLEARHLDEILTFAIREYDGLEAKGFIPEEWFAFENMLFAEVIDLVRDAYLKQDPLTLQRVELARAGSKSRFFEALGRVDFDWLYRETWPTDEPDIELQPTKASHLKLVVDRGCDDPLSKK